MPPSPPTRVRRAVLVLSHDRALTRSILFYVALVVLLVIYFAVMRLGLVLRNLPSTYGTSTRQILYGFYVGAGFDLRVACAIVLPAMLVGCLPHIGVHRSRRHRAILLAALGTWATLSTLLLMAEFEFFHEFQTRFNLLAVEYLDQPKIVAGMLWYNYPVGWYVIGTALMVAVFTLSVRAMMRRTLTPHADDAAPAGMGIRRWAGIGLLTILMTITVFWPNLWSVFEADPLERSSSEFVNQISENGLIAMARVVRGYLWPNDMESPWLRQMPLAQARAIAANLVLDRDDKLLDPDRRTLLRGEHVADAPFALKPTKRPPNVVVILMESFSARVCGAVGSPEDLTPNFDRIARQGILFDRALSNGTHTHQGIFCTLLGFPNLPGFGYLMKTSVAYQPFASLPRIFQNAGYHTMFLYAGDASWDNVESFLGNQGIERFVSRKDFSHPVFEDAVWGVSDQDLLGRANEEFEKADKHGPFFATVLTVSNHAPFLLPSPLPFTPTTDKGEMNARYNGMRYADWAIGRFIEDARQRDYFRNTLFVFVGDHGFSVFPVMTPLQLLYHHVPLVFYSPHLLPASGTVRHEVASQVDIAPSIVALTRIQTPISFWGKNLFSEKSRADHFAIFKNADGREVGMIRGDRLMVIDAESKPHLYRYDLSFPPSIQLLSRRQNLADIERMNAELRAYIQSAITDLAEGHAGFGADRLAKTDDF